MMKSMTGFGTVTRSTPSGKFTVLIQSVNNKRGLDIHLQIPASFSANEQPLKKRIGEKIGRGRIQVSVEWDSVGKEGKQWQVIDAKAYHHYLEELGKVIPEESIRPETILRLPGVFLPPAGPSSGQAQENLLQVLEKALQEFDRSRSREGKALAKDILSHIQTIASGLTKIRSRAPQVVTRYRETLISRLADLGLPDVWQTDERVLKEIALYADRSDISEEMTRLEAHLKEGKRLCRSVATAGKNLEFLTQEMGREINTIGSKANDLEIANTVLAMKAALEKIREQVYNVE